MVRRLATVAALVAVSVLAPVANLGGAHAGDTGAPAAVAAR